MTAWKSPGMTPDEYVYETQARIAREEGCRVATRAWADTFYDGLAMYPSPLRWLWVWVTRWVGVARLSMWVGVVSCVCAAALVGPYSLGWAVAFGVLFAGAPLEQLLSARKLQDTTIAAVTLAAIACAYNGHPVAAMLTCVVLLCMKEAGVLMLPAVCLAGVFGFIRHVFSQASGTYPLYPPLALYVLTPLLSVPLWLALTRWALGPSCWRVMRIARAGHATDYTRQHQSGMPHRLLVDLMLVSPFTTALALWSRHPLVAVAAAIVAAHAFAPVRNVRTILAADLLLRAACVAWLAERGWWGAGGCVGLMAYDLWVSGRMRGLRDTPTHALAQAIGAVP